MLRFHESDADHATTCEVTLGFLRIDGIRFRRATVKRPTILFQRTYLSAQFVANFPHRVGMGIALVVRDAKNLSDRFRRFIGPDEIGG